jgi:SagB-type dehydrogenase family enzyme
MDTTVGETATQALHRLTSYEPGRDWTAPADDPRVVQDLQVNDLERLPWFFKRYPQGLPRLALPRDLPQTAAPAIAVLAGTAHVTPAALDLPHLSRLLYLSAGVVRTMERPHGVHPFRAAGSAGGRFPLELYVAVPEGGPLPPGVHWYDPLEHALVQVGTAPRGGAPAVVVTGVPWRTGWRYRERGWRHVYWDAGTMLAQMLALADSAGLTAALYTRFPDAAVAELTGADRVHEMPVAVVALGEGGPALDPGGPAAAGSLDAAPIEFPLVTAAQRAGDGDRLGPPWDRGAPADVPVPGSATVEAVVAARGSQRRMDAARGLPQELLRTSMSVAIRGVGVTHWVVVHDVEGLAAGIYRWPDLRVPVRPGALRGELHRVCLRQALARDAAFVAIAAADIGGLDDREYREAHFAAGLAEGRMHLAAYALGASASGMTFIDSEVPGLLGEPLDALLFTCVGVPAYRSAAGGPPGAPSRVRPVRPAAE